MSNTTSTSFKEPFINKLDLFGFNFKFLLQEREYQRSELGLILTISYIFIVLSLFFGFGSDMYLRKSPKVSFSSNSGEHNTYQLSNSNFTYAYRIEDEEGLIIEDESIIYLELTYWFSTLEDGAWVQKFTNQIIPKKCNEFSDIKQKEQIYNISLENWFCIDFDNMTIGGDYDGNFVYGIEIFAKQCNSSITRNNCSSEQTIYDFFYKKTTVYLSFLYMDIMPTLKDYNQPLKTSLKNIYEVLDLGILKKNIHHFKITQMDDDRGWIFPEIETSSIYSSDSYFKDIALKDMWNSNILVSHCIYFGRKTENYFRSFIKVQEVFASIGGFSSFFFKIIILIVGLFDNVNRNLFLINNMFFNLEDEGEGEIIKNICEKRELNNFKNINIIVSDKVIHIPNKFKKLNIVEYFINKCCKKRKSNQRNAKIYNKFELFDKYMKNVMNILTYFNLYKEFENLKKLILNQNEIKSLMINKPKLEDEIILPSHNLIKDFNYFENSPVKILNEVEESYSRTVKFDSFSSQRQLELKEKDNRHFPTN